MIQPCPRINIGPSGRQGMINYTSLKSVAPGKIGQADLPERHVHRRPGRPLQQFRGEGEH